MFDPNQHAPTFGGDGLTIHYNLQYHATYGNGSHLESQYYPHGETIFMTDAQGMIAVILAKLRSTLPSLHNYSVGISNVLIYWSNPIAALVLFLCFLKMNINPKLAVIFAVLIALLSPQIQRQMCGHYALGYAFLIPIIFYHALDSKLTKWSYIRAGLIILLLIFFGLNNPYLLAISCSFLVALGGFAFLASLILRKKYWRYSFLSLVPAIISLIVTSGILHSLDRVNNRVAIPEGFMNNTLSLRGLLLPDGTLLSSTLTKALGLRMSYFENNQYLGLVSALFLLSLPILIFLGRKFLKRLFAENNLFLIFLSSLSVAIFSFGIPFIYFKEWSYAHLGEILQFRAPGRFAWIFYYGFSLITVKALSLWLSSLIGRGATTKAWIIVIAITTLWAADMHYHFTWTVDGKLHHNAFHPSQLKQYKTIAKNHKINPDNYCGIFLLPTEHGWTDKVYHGGSFRSNYEGYRLSIATALPLINGKLSRMSVSHTLSSMELMGDTLIKKDILDLLPQDKSILILSSLENKMSKLERQLEQSAEEVYASKKYRLGKLEISDYKDQLYKSRKRILAGSKLDSSAGPILYQSYDTEETTIGYSGNSSQYIERGQEELLSLPIDNSYLNSESDTLELSFWYYVENDRFGFPIWQVDGISGDTKTYESSLFGNSILESHNGWLRASFILPMSDQIDHISLSSDSKISYYIDNLMVRNINHNTTTITDGEVFYNNYKVEE